jgi:hypothetical protein
MECFGVKLAHKGECKKDEDPTRSESSSAEDGCMCAEIFAPVCGTDNMTYPNGEFLIGAAAFKLCVVSNAGSLFPACLPACMPARLPACLH